MDNLAIVETKVKAVVKRIQPLFDRKHLLEDSPYKQVLTLQRIADKLEWILDHINHEGRTWKYSDLRSIDYLCRGFTNISFSKLGQNYPRVLKAVCELGKGGYLDWVSLD